MTLYVADINGYIVDIASNGGWHDFITWVLKLKSSPVAKAFVTAGNTDEPRTLAKELAKVKSSNKSADSVRKGPRMGKSIESRENWIGADRHDRRGMIYVSSAAARRRRDAGAREVAAVGADHGRACAAALGRHGGRRAWIRRCGRGGACDRDGDQHRPQGPG